jgi:hypothetical protein
MLYVVGAPQAFHFRTLFEVARRWSVTAELTHIAFGSVLGNDGKAIPGLYACGNDMASVMAGSYPGPGTTLGPAIVFAYRAAMHAKGAPL